MALVSVSNGAITNTLEYRVRLAGALVMLLASAGLIAWGWSRVVAVRGLSWGMALILLVYMISAGWDSAGLAGLSGEGIWTGEPGVKGADLLLGTIGDLSQWGLPAPEIGGPDIVVAGVSSPALRWLLRGEQRVTYTSQTPVESSPALVITANQPNLALAGTYRGQSFLLGEKVNWSQLEPADWFRWLALHSAPPEALQKDQIILWARADLFPGGDQPLPGGQNQGAPGQ
jgi:hypothetical protein